MERWSPSSIGRPLSCSRSLVPGAGRSSVPLRPVTPIRVATGMRPGTSGHQCSTPIVKVTNRPLIQHGLSGMKTCVKGPQRQILDKSYYLGLVRSKLNEVTAENSKLLKEIDTYKQDNADHLYYEERCKCLAAEIKDLQGQLADHNMLVDNMNTNMDMEEMISEYNDLKADNDREAESINKIITQKGNIEEAIRAIEGEIMREKQIADELFQAMPAAKQRKYISKKTANEELLQEKRELQAEMALLRARKEDYEAELSHCHQKQQMVRLYQTLSELEAKRDSLEAEHKNQRSPHHEKKQLLKQVKKGNKAIARMEKELTEIRDRTAHVSNQIQQLEQDSEEAQAERQEKYKKLKMKEEQIDCYMASFEKLRAQELEKIRQIKENSVSSRQHTSRPHESDTVTASELRNMAELLVCKEREMVKSQNTAGLLSTEYQRLQRDLEMVQQMEAKVTAEISRLTKNINTMETELVTYRDLGALERSAKEEKKRLKKDRASFTLRRDSLRQLLKEMNQQYEALKTELETNETHAALTQLESKWQHLEQNNFTMMEFIASKSKESDYSSIAKNVFQQLAEYNSLLCGMGTNKR